MSPNSRCRVSEGLLAVYKLLLCCGAADALQATWIADLLGEYCSEGHHNFHDVPRHQICL